MLRVRTASLAALAAATCSIALLGAPSVSHARGPDDASLRALHAELTAVGDAPATAVEPSKDERASIREDTELATSTREPETHWYGWETLTVDAVSVAAMPLAGVGVAGYLVGAPIVHAAHDRWGAAAASLGLRVALPIAGAYAGVALANCGNSQRASEDWCGLGEAVLGLGVGMLAAIVIDAAVLGYERAPAAQASEPSTGRAATRTSVAIAPWIERDRKGASLAFTF